MSSDTTTDQLAIQTLEEIRQDEAPDLSPDILEEAYKILARSIAAEDPAQAKNALKTLIERHVSEE